MDLVRSNVPIVTIWRTDQDLASHAARRKAEPLSEETRFREVLTFIACPFPMICTGQSDCATAVICPSPWHGKQLSPLEPSKPRPPQSGQTQVGAAGGSITPLPAQTGHVNVLSLPVPLQKAHGTCPTCTETDPSPWQTAHSDFSESWLYGSVPFPWQKSAVDFLPVDCLRDHFITPLNEFAERTQIQVEILVFQTEVLLQPLHLLRKLEKGTPQPLHFLVGQ